VTLRDVSVHPGGSIESGPKPTKCEPAEAALCLTKSVFATTVSQGTTKTTATSVTETCATITGCSLRDVESTTKADVCTIRPRAVQETGVPAPQQSATWKREGASSTARKVKPRAGNGPNWYCEQPGLYGIIWPLDPTDNNAQAEIRRILDDQKLYIPGNGYLEVRAKDLEFTAFYVVDSLGPEALAYFNSNAMPEIYLAYHPDNPVLPPHINPRQPFKRDSVGILMMKPAQGLDTQGENVTVESFDQRTPQSSFEQKDLNDNAATMEPIQTRAVDNGTKDIVMKRILDDWVTDAWHLSMISWPPNFNFDEDQSPHEPSANKFYMVWDDSWGQGQTVYVMEAAIDDTSPVSYLRFLPSFLLL
jgi:chitinase